MTRILALLVAAALSVSCTSDSAPEQAQPASSSSSSQAQGATGIASIFDVLPRDQVDDFNDDERYLASLLISPLALDDDYLVHLVQTDDPNGGAEIGDRWYEPRLRIEECSYATDQAPMPIVEGGYIPGDPSESTTSNPFAVVGAPHQLGTRIQLFDTSEQRDSFAAVMRDANVAARDLDCFATSLFGSVTEFTPPDFGYPGYGFKYTDAPGSEGDSYVVQHLVGDRVLLTSTLGAAGFDDAPAANLELATLEPFITRQIASLQATGLG